MLYYSSIFSLQKTKFYNDYKTRGMWPWAAPGSWIPTTSPYYIPRHEGEELTKPKKETNKAPIYCLLVVLALLIVIGSILTPVLLIVKNNGKQ